MKRTIAILLTLCLLLSSVTAGVFAEGNEETESPIVIVEAIPEDIPEEIPKEAAPPAEAPAAEPAPEKTAEPEKPVSQPAPVQEQPEEPAPQPVPAQDAPAEAEKANEPDAAVIAAPEEPQEPVAEVAETLPEAPAAEEPVVEEPAAEEPVVEEPAAEEPAVEEPAAEEPAVEEPAAKEPAAEETQPEEALPQEGYALMRAGQTLYANASLTAPLGKLQQNAVVYVTARSDNDVLTVLAAVNGSAVTAWIRAANVTFRSEAEAGAADVRQGGIRLINVVFEAEEAPAGEEPAEKPAEKPAEEAAAGVPEEAAAETVIPAESEAPAEEVPAGEEPAEEAAEEATTGVPEETAAESVIPAETEIPSEPEAPAEEVPAEEAAAGTPEEAAAETETPAETELPSEPETAEEEPTADTAAPAFPALPDEYTGPGEVWRYDAEDDEQLSGALIVKGKPRLDIAFETCKSATMIVGSAATFGLGFAGGYAPYTVTIYAYKLKGITDGYWDLTYCGNAITKTNVKSSCSFSFTPKSSGFYTFLVDVKESNGSMLRFWTGNYNASKAEDASNTSTVLGKVKYLVSKLVTSSMSNWQKARVLHDWLATHATYNYADLDDQKMINHVSSGVLLKGKGVCESFAGAYASLLTAAGVPNITIKSNTDNHTWNLVWMNNKWLHVDVTWDVGGRTTYFGLTDSEISSDHHWNKVNYSDGGSLVPNTTENVAVLSNSISVSSVTKYSSPKKQTFTLKASCKGGAKLSFKSSSTKITIDASTGKVTIPANYVGKATITVTSGTAGTYKKTTKTVTITVKPSSNKITASDLKVNASNSTKTYQLEVSRYGGAKLSYKSSNSKVTVSSTGKITVPKKFYGNVTITITAAATSVYKAATKKITLTVARLKNTITAYDWTVKPTGESLSFSLIASCKSGSSMTYSSNCTDVKVSSKGTVTVAAGFAGIAEITITAPSTGIYKQTVKTITISVLEPEY